MAVFCFKEKDETINMLLTGRVTIDPEVRHAGNNDVISFSMSYGKKKYMKIEAWSDTAAAQNAGRLEKGDSLLVAGTLRVREYNEKTYQSVTADTIIPGEVPVMLAGGTTAEDGGGESGKEALASSVPPGYSDLSGEEDDQLPF